MNWNPTWICPANDLGDPAAVFGTSFVFEKKITHANLTITAMGVYEAKLNGRRVGQFVMAPGWTSYHKRLQYQEYDITDLLTAGENHIEVTVGKGWYRSPLPGWGSPYQDELRSRPCGLAAQITLTFEDGSSKILSTDESWKVSDGPVRFSEIYDGEIYDSTKTPLLDQPVTIFDGPTDTLILQQGEEVCEQERLAVKKVFVTPNGETVLDFGQNMTGYVELFVNANVGDCVDLSFAEVMDKDGNFYTENYRGAKAQYHYICSDGVQTWHPSLTFYGFRYIRINDFPGSIDCVKPENFTAIVVHSNMKRTGFLSSSNTLLNQLFSNIIWGQKGNFLDVPTDCPQRDERLGWTGDAQVFVRTACLNYDVEKFFTKWLADLASDQHDDGYVGHVIPDLLQNPQASSSWGDAATICPWQVYLAFGNKQILKNQYQSMKKWIDYITSTTTTKYLWTGGTHYGDWLGLDAPSGSYKGSSNEDFIASAFYAYSTSLVIQAGTVLGEDVSELSTLYENIVSTFQKTWPTYHTQTECVLAAYFKLAKNCQAAADQLADMVRACGTKLQTGFVGTPYLLHVLSDYGHTDLAWDLLLRTKYPSWLYPVTKGATTIWEHWDGIMEDGNFWSKDMNSYNHYAYGSVADWVYSVAAGILQRKDAPGYAKVTIAPHPDKRLDWLRAELDTRHGHISSFWTKEDDSWRYEITVPVEADIVIDGVCHSVRAGSYCFYSKQ
jgi:alpha-L-rhamnosidase